MWGNLVRGRAEQLGPRGRSDQALEFTGPAEMRISVTSLPGGKAGPSGPGSQADLQMADLQMSAGVLAHTHSLVSPALIGSCPIPGLT